MLEQITVLDEILSAHVTVLGADFVGYRNHVYRVTNLCLMLTGSATASIDKLAVAAAYHDLGIWTHGTFDYLPPSIELARAHLERAGRSDWEPEISAMIADHHKLRGYSAGDKQLVELFRRADWIDVSLGLRTFGLPRAALRDLIARFPDEGFHRRLMQLAVQRALHHPTSPLPMLRW